LGGGAGETGERGAERRKEREGRERRRWRGRKTEKKTGGEGRTKDRWTTGAKDLVTCLCYTRCYVGCRISISSIMKETCPLFDFKAPTCNTGG